MVKKKILIVNTFYHPNIIGGAEISTQFLAEKLSEFNLIPVVITTSSRDYVNKVNGVKVYYVFHSNLYWRFNVKNKNRFIVLLWHLCDMYNYKIAKKLRKIIEKEKPDIIHTNNLSGFSVSLWNIARKMRIPIVHTLRDYYLLCPRGGMFYKGVNCNTKLHNCKYFSIIKKYYSKYINAVVGISKYILDVHLKNGYFKNADKYIINNPISEIQKGVKKKKVQLPLTFAYFGRLSIIKGLILLINNFQDIKDANLFIFGNGITIDYQNKLIRKYKSSRIRFFGFVDIHKVLPNIDVVIIPSLWNEPFSRVKIEAYSYGIPVIVSNRGGAPEGVEVGKTGFIFDPDKENDLKDKIELFIRKPRIIENMSINCINKAQEYKNLNITNKYLEIYNKLLHMEK